MSFIYSETNGFNDSKIGRLANPLKMVIEAESDNQKKKGGALEVGKASTNAVVMSSVMILLADVILTHLMLT